MSAPALAVPLNQINIGEEYRAAVGGPPDDGKRYGTTEPRVVTPPLRVLTPETSWGFRVIEFARDVLRVDLLPWQRSLVIRMLERLVDGSLRFRTAVLLVARQNGKSTLSKVLSLWFLMEAQWPLVLGTAQDLETAEEIWEDALNLLIDDEDDEADLSDHIEKISMVNGKKFFQLDNGCRYKVKAANRKAGRGLSGNFILLDELREQTTWDAWSAITKTTNAQDMAMIYCMSNAGDSLSVVLSYLRKMAHRAAGDPDGINEHREAATPSLLDIDGIVDLADAIDDHADDDGAEDDLEESPNIAQDEATLFIAEYSAPPGISVWNRDGWAQANPSMGYLIQERTIASDCATDPEQVFRTEVLCQWPDGVTETVFPAGTWAATTNTPEELDDGTKRVADEDRLVGDVWVGIDKSYDRSRTWISFCGYRTDGLPQIEVHTQRGGDDWVKTYLENHRWRDRIQAVAGQAKSAPVSSLMQELAEDDAFPFPVLLWGGQDLTNAHGDIYEEIRDGKLRHNVQPPLDTAAATAVQKFLGEAWVIDRRRSPSDTAPLISAIAANWARTKKPKETPVPAAPAVLDEDTTTHDDYANEFATMGF